MRYLILVLAVVAGVLFWRSYLRARSSHEAGRAAPPVGTMVQCRRCRVYLPENDAIRAGDNYYCCEEHRDQDVA